MTENEIEKSAPIVLSKLEKIALGLLIFAKYKKDSKPFSSSAGTLIVQNEELASIKNSDVKKLQELDWRQQTLYLWEFIL